jgi:dTDP-4-dehydrorhamnose reductase
VRALLTGAGGQVAREIYAALSATPKNEILALSHGELDITDRERALQVCGEWAPEVVINAAAFTAVDSCEAEPERAFAVNALGARNLAEGASLAGAHMVHISTDYVFDGAKATPYTEWDETRPLSAYGKSKLAGEREVLSVLPGAAVVRTSWVCSRHGSNILRTILRLATSPGQLRFVDDQRGSPTFADDLAGVLCRLALSRAPGVFHVTNQGATTWYGFAREVLAAAGHDPSRVEPVKTSELDPPRPAPRPANSVLDNAVLRLLGWPLLPHYSEPLERTVRALVASP